ncbi:UNVERIFIED_CONTAM: hypothetical protein GTU68_027965 [Idotea baltica]|nr:hypothetical protein [Idotea baltica]
MFRKILIANRGEIACRVIRSARDMGVRTVAVYSDADAAALHVEMADESVRIGPPSAAESYLKVDAIVEACKRTGAEAVHPGYGFLSENPDFVDALDKAGIAFIGPSADAIRAMGLKDAAKKLMEQAGVPVVPGYHGEGQDPAALAKEADGIGYPVLIKARAGGGGKGMRRVDDPKDFAEALAGAQREGKASFGDGHVLIEKYVTSPRHIEIQVFGDGHGNAVHLFERDCSLQRRHQKVIEEAPAPGMTEGMRAAMGEAAVRAAKAIGYSGAGTVEFIVDASDGLRADRFYFMEMNTRLQVEHPVTEEITGVDLVELQLHVAAGGELPFEQDDLAILGHAMEARIYAEDAVKGFLPATGTLHHLRMPEDVRVDTGVRQGDTITPHYDPMIAKVVVHEESREAALGAMRAALDSIRVAGTVTNVGFLARLIDHEGFASGDVDTGLIDRDLESLIADVAPSASARALAALGAIGLPRDSGKDPWDSLMGWRAWGPAQQSALIEQDGERLDAKITIHDGARYTVRIGEDTTRLRFHGGAVDIDGIGMRVDVLTHPGGATVFMDGEAHRFSFPDPVIPANEAAGGDTILAPMPGAVKNVTAKVGGTVAKGDALIVLEAMKMEHTLTAPRDGKIAEVNVAEGDQVEDGAVLLSLETDAF